MNDKKPLIVKCPRCGAEVIWGEQSPHRPFCSERCRNQDFIDWAKEEHRIGGDANYDDVLSDDLPKQ